MMRIGIITANNLWFCPYVQIYRVVLDEKKIPYDIITWCRDGKDEQGCIQYKNKRICKNSFQKFFSYFSFASFVKKTIKANNYDKLIVFTPQVGIFISSFLKKYFKGKYIFDYRDLSIEQTPFFKKSFLRLLNNSVFNVISSPGFQKYLPKRNDYILSHNFDIDAVRYALENTGNISCQMSERIDVLTIGGIRDYESNVQVMDALANIDDFTLRFIGRGPSAEPLKIHAEKMGISNVYFKGFYTKEKEPEYISSCTFLNIFYPQKPSHDTALSNRFYNSLIYKKPMITTAGTTQGDYAVKYNVGIALKDCTNLAEELKCFIEEMDYDEYCKQCNILLNEFIYDYEKFYAVLTNFIKN